MGNPKDAYSRSHMPRHPPCVPSASCQPVRCHPAPPPCQNPERCLRRTTSKNIRPCQSALSIMSSRSKASCARSCGKYKGDPRSVRKVEKYLKRKSRELRMRQRDRLTGGHSYLRYTRRKGTPRAKQACCAGKGHRGRLKRSCCSRCCEIL